MNSFGFTFAIPDPVAQPANDEVIEFSYNHDFVLISNIGTARRFRCNLGIHLDYNPC
jgi:hypothetical protein